MSVFARIERRQMLFVPKRRAMMPARNSQPRWNRRVRPALGFKRKERFMAHKTKPLVEVAARTVDGRVPLGIMNTRQALDLPEELDVEISHPDKEAGVTDHFIDRDELRKVRKKARGKQRAD
jgi:hypothetical protein